MEQLDPVRDHAEIIRLSISFYLSPMAVDWVFALSMPRFNIGPSGAAIFRGGKGKLLMNSDRRYDDTDDHFLVWIEYGPDSPQVKRSLDIINALHAKWSKEYPAEFDDLDLWLYVLAWEICGTSSIFTEYLGLPEPSEKEKIAKVVFGKKLAELFVYVDGRPLSEVIPASLETYEDWVAYLHEYESRPWEYNAESAACLAQVVETFEKRFPMPLPRSFVRALATSFWHDGMFGCCDIERPGRLMSWAARMFMRVGILMGRILPDPKESLTEKLRRESAETGKPLRAVLKATQVPSPSQGSTARCPMGFGG
ncbi:hypothetical protein [Streptomyces justiciae]|uniref:hypothetical protein n=1 Tax=Streptomyces justiciae TaxID=2780140 RepID=UPI0021195DCE|nr:hypothetical protein [Streptomyces justiciae]MCW8379702.1 hypothetical protein [Streptomyces justiciae]